jgi:hypothetical protein
VHHRLPRLNLHIMARGGERKDCVDEALALVPHTPVRHLGVGRTHHLDMQSHMHAQGALES